MATFQVRVCSKCNESKSLDSFGFIKSRNYRLTICKCCETKRKREWLANNPEKLEQVKLKNRDYAKKYREMNKEECKRKTKEYRLNHPEKVKQWKKADYRKHKAEYSLRHSLYRLKNKEAIRELTNMWVKENPDKVKIIKSKYNNSDKGRASKHNNRALRREKIIGYKITFSDIENLRETQNNRCFYCDNSLSNSCELEHIIPISKGGEHKLYNLVLSCKSCNNKKYTKDPEQFINEILEQAI